MLGKTGRLAISLACMSVILTSAGCGGRQDGDVFMRVRTDEAGNTRKCTKEERAEIAVQLEVVRNYWALPYEDEYNTLSAGFKQQLTAAGAATASDYARVMASNQRQWLKQTYQEAELRSPMEGRVTVLAEWKEAGYQGVRTVIFDMVKEDGAWKIASIFY